MFSSCYTDSMAVEPVTSLDRQEPTLLQRVMQRFGYPPPVVAFSEVAPPPEKKKYIKLTGRELVKCVRTLSLWSGFLVKRPHLLREFLFPNSAEAVKFVKSVIEKATALNHFPKIVFVKNRVAITLRTTEIDGISTKDIELARLIEEC
jgi:4a-hydroxytetrahydrobiopterin dehydratase